MAEGLPPIKEPVDFEDVKVVNATVGQVLIVSGTQPDHWQMALEDDVDPSIPEPEWIRWHVVGYHFGEYRPDPQSYELARDVPDAPPGARGIEVVGKTTTRQVALW